MSQKSEVIVRAAGNGQPPCDAPASFSRGENPQAQMHAHEAQASQALGA